MQGVKVLPRFDGTVAHLLCVERTRFVMLIVRSEVIVIVHDLCFNIQWFYFDAGEIVRIEVNVGESHHKNWRAGSFTEIDLVPVSTLSTTITAVQCGQSSCRRQYGIKVVFVLICTVNRDVTGCTIWSNLL